MLMTSVILVRGRVGLRSALSLPASSTGCSRGDRQYVMLFQLSSKGGKQSGSPTSVSCSPMTLKLRGQAGGSSESLTPCREAGGGRLVCSEPVEGMWLPVLWMVLICLVALWGCPAHPGI